MVIDLNFTKDMQKEVNTVRTKKHISYGKGITTVLLAIVMMFSMSMTAMAGEECTGSDCTHSVAIGNIHYKTLEEALTELASDTEITVLSADGLREFAVSVNSGKDYSGLTVKLAKDIDLGNAETWTPIGTSAHKFCGTFDGQNHTISNISVAISGNGAGLFGVVGGGAHIKNLVVSGNISTTGKYAGGIVGYSSGSGQVTIENCGNEATVTAGGANAAGIIGCNDGSQATFLIRNCYNVGTITGGTESAAISGWLGNNAVVEHCWNKGTVTTIQEGKYFARFNSALFTNCYQWDQLAQQDKINAFTDADMSSGKLTALLGEAWGQKLGEDTYPTFLTEENKVHILYEANTCTPIGYSNSSEGNTMPTHDENYESLGKCMICGTTQPGSIYEQGLDVSEMSEDQSGVGWAWDAGTKTLTLTDCEIRTDAAAAITLPDGAMIVLNGNNKITSNYLMAKAIHALGSLTIRGNENSSLYVAAGGGYTIFCEKEGNDVTLCIETVQLVTEGGSITLPSTNQNSSLYMTGSTLDTTLQRIQVFSGANSEKMSFVVRDSRIVSEKIDISDTTKEESNKLIFLVDNSSIDATQSSGSVTESALQVSGKDIDLDVQNSDLRAWTKGHSWGANSYGVRVDCYGDATIHFAKNNILTYGSSTGFYIDVTGKIIDGSVIEDCTIISYAKNNPGTVHVWDQDDDDDREYGNVDRKADVFRDCLLFEYGYMQGETADDKPKDRVGAATVIGNPEISRDFKLEASIGLDVLLSTVTPTITMGDDQKITIADGVTVDITEGVVLGMPIGAVVSGNYQGKINSTGAGVLITFDYGEYLNVYSIEPGSEVEAPIQEEACHRIVWYKNAELGERYDFGQPVSESITLYANWETSHNWGAWEKQDETHHIRICGRDSEHTEQAEHVEGTMASSGRVVCAICNEEYGNVIVTENGSIVVGGNTIGLPGGGTVIEEENGDLVIVPNDTNVNVNDSEVTLPENGIVVVEPESGNVKIPAGSSIQIGDTEFVLSTDSTMDPEGTNMVGENGSVIINGTTVILPEGGKVIVDKDGNVVIIPNGVEVKLPSGMVSLPENGAVVVDKDGKILQPVEKEETEEESESTPESEGNGIRSYMFLSGVNSCFVKGSGEDISFKADGDYADYTEVKVDGNIIDHENYDSYPGSTVIVLKSKYLETLSVGQHTLTIQYKDGAVSCNFIIEGRVNAPLTGDMNMPLLWMTLALTSGMVLVGIAVCSKRRGM